MAKLDTAARNALPAKDFAEPQARKFPVNDRPHAINAKARGAQMAARGIMSRGTLAKIKAKANQVLDK